MISSDDLDGYRKRLGGLEEQAKQRVERDLRQWAADHPQPNKDDDPRAHAKWVASFRDRSREVMTERSEMFENASATLAADLYDKLASDAGIKASSPTLKHYMTKRRMQRIGHYQASKLVNGDIDGFIDQIGNACRDGVKQAARNTTMKGVESDAKKKRDVKFARVLRGPENCGFCFMLATRGFAYTSAATAGALNPDHYHRGCNCDVIAGFGKDKSIEGYDLEGMEKRYSQAVKMLDRRAIYKQFDALPESEKAKYGKKTRTNEDRFNGYWAKKITELLELFDPKYLYDGTQPKVEYADEAVKAKKKKDPNHAAEKKVADKLRTQGFRTVFVNDEITEPDAKTGRKRVVGLPDLDTGLEIKSVAMARSENTISKHIGGAKKKRGYTQVVIDVSENDYLTDDMARAMISNSLRRHGLSSALMVNHSGEVEMIFYPMK